MPRAHEGEGILDGLLGFGDHDERDVLRQVHEFVVRGVAALRDQLAQLREVAGRTQVSRLVHELAKHQQQRLRKEQLKEAQRDRRKQPLSMFQVRRRGNAGRTTARTRTSRVCCQEIVS